MSDRELITALRKLKIQTNSFACLGCGHEHNCGVRGCAVIREALEALQRFQWIPVTERLPGEGERVLASDGVFVGEAYLDSFGIWRRSYGVFWRVIGGPITHWMPLPGTPEVSCNG
jgi:hypothetical protein